MLSTYSTTRFVKMLNLPLLPIGKTRMVDECPQCGNRGTTSFRTYNKERKRNLALMMEGFAAEADNPENCAHALHTLMVYDMQSWFHDVQKSYGMRFETNMQIQYLIAQGLSRFGDYKEAMIYCRKAIVLGAGRQAEELLAFCQTLLEASEGIDDLEALKVQSESALRAYIPLFTLTATAAVFLITASVSSLRNYKAWIVNGSLQKYTFALDDEFYELESGATKQITLRLGEHELKIDGMPPHQFNYSIPLIKQLLEKHLLVINPDAMALLAVAEPEDNIKDSRTTYSHVGQIRIYPGLGNPQHGLRRISSDVKRTDSISLYRPESHMAMVDLMVRLELEKAAIKYARRALLMEPASEESDELLKVALRDTNDSGTMAFLSKELDSSPALLPWHRYYQNYMQAHHPEHNLEREYTLRCKNYPEEPASYYLLASVVQDRQTAYSFFEHSDKENGMGGLGLHAIAHDLYLRGQFKEALSYSRKAMQCAPHNASFKELNEKLLLALRDYDTLLTNTLKSRITSSSRSLAEKTVLYLTCAGYHQEAAAEISKLGEKWPEDLPRFNAIRFYAVGNVSDYLECMGDMGHPHTTVEKFLHLNQIAEADEFMMQHEDHPYWEHLVLYCAAMNQNLLQLAEHNLAKAIAEVDMETGCRHRITKLLTGEMEATEEAVRDIDIPAPEKTILCVALNYRFPDNKQRFNELALVYNFTPAYPQLLLRKWIRESAPSSTPAGNPTHTVALGL